MAKYGLIGKSLTHSRSKYLHSLIGDYEYELIELDNSSELLEVLKNEEYDGFNVTIPYKQDVIQYLDEISDRANAANAVNCIKRLPDGRLMGYNTDIYGFEYTVEDEAKGKNCLVLGTGGAARAVAVALKLRTAARVRLVSRDPEAAVRRIGDSLEIISYEDLKHCYDTEIIVNATPVGQIPEVYRSPIIEAGINMSYFPKLELAIDLIYNPCRTKFLQDAKRFTNCRTKSGIDMLITQAIDSRNIWLGRRNNRSEEKKLLKSIRRKMLETQLNVVAVGMPGSGKTTLFRRYAYEKKLQFIDVDELTEKLMGASIPEVLADSSRGETYFRECEFEAVKSLSSCTNCVIASGGGSVLNPISRDIFKCNSIVVYVKRPLENLSTKGRPISQMVGVFELFKKRNRVYKNMADVFIYNSTTFGDRTDKQNNAVEYHKDMGKYVSFVKRKIERHINEIVDNKWT